MSTLRLLTDQALGDVGGPGQDGLGFDTYAQILGGAAVSTPGPLTIGIFGEWGTGKTSLMQMISTSLSKKPDVLAVWFNAWRYEKEEHPIVPLVATILKELQRNKSFLKRIGDGGRELLRSLRAVAYGFSAKSKVKVPGFAEVEASFVAKDMIERADNLRPDPLLDRSLYYDAFETLSSIDFQGKIIVFIDDLDRCFPDLAIKLLESIKLALSQPGFVFVMGVARTVIEGYLNYRYREDYGLKDFDGASYLDKIVQVPFYIPPHRARIDFFLENMLNAIDPSIQADFAKVRPIIAAAGGSNPRATKRFINNLLIDKAINMSLASEEMPESARMEEIPLSYFAVTRALQQRWRDMFSLLSTSVELCAHVAQWSANNIADYTASKDADLSAMATTLLGDRSLRDLLFSEEGNTWLTHYDIRTATIEFLKEKRIDDKAQISKTSAEFDVFISYHSDDQPYVSKIARFFSDLNLTFFIDSEQIMPGEDWRVKIENALMRCRAFVVCIGQHSAMRGWQHREIEMILGRASTRPDLRIIPILLPGANVYEIPTFLKRIQSVDLRNGVISEDNLRQLQRALP